MIQLHVIEDMDEVQRKLKSASVLNVLIFVPEIELNAGQISVFKGFGFSVAKRNGYTIMGKPDRVQTMFELYDALLATRDEVPAVVEEIVPENPEPSC
jgi:hypothetical protein